MRLSLLFFAATVAACTSHVEAVPADPAPPLDEVASRGFVLDGDALTSAQAQWRTSLSPAGVTRFAAQPFAPHPQPTELELKLVGVSRGHDRELAEQPRRETRGARTELAWGPVTERLEAHPAHLEQSFLFTGAPEGTGALTLTLAVSGFDTARVDERGAHFSVARSPVGVRYGHGTWVDARGRRTPVPVQLSGATLRLVVPDAVLGASEFPAVLDPVLEAEVVFPDGGAFVPAPRAQRAPAVAASDAGWLVVWEDLRHALYRGSDIYAARVLFDGGVLDPSGIPIATAPGDQLEPAVTFNGQDFVVAWRDQRTGGNHTWAAFVSPAGSPGVPQRLVPANNGDQWHPRLASNGELTLIAWEQVALTAARLLNDGGVLDPNGFVLAPWPSAAAHDLAWTGQFFAHTHEDNGPQAMLFFTDGGTRPWPLADGGTSNTLSLTTSTNNALYGRTISLTPLGDGRVGALWPRSNGGQWPAAIHSAVVDPAGTVSEYVLRSNADAIDVAQVRAAFDGEKLLGCASAATGQSPPRHALAVSLGLDASIGPVVTLTRDAGDPNVECTVGSGPGVVLAVYRTNHENEPTLRYQVLAGATVSPATERVLSNTINPQEHPAVARSGFTSQPWLIAWSDARTPYSGFDVFAQRLAGDGGASVPFVVSARAADEVGVRVLGVGDAGYVVTWSEGNPLDSSTRSQPKALRVSAAGVRGALLDFPINSGFPSYQAPVAALEGRTVVVTAGFNSFNINNFFEGWNFDLHLDAGIGHASYTSSSERSGLRLVPRDGALLAVWDDGQRI